MKTFKAIALNIVYPGTGYLYLKDYYRETAAKFLVLVWTLFLGMVIYELIKSFVTGNFYAFSGDMTIPGLAVAMWIGMCVDTYFLAKKRSK